MPPILFPLHGPKLNTAGTGIRKRGVAPTLCGGRLLPSVYWRIAGVTKDSTGAALASATVQLFDTSTDRIISEVVSDANGIYEFRSPSLPTNYYVVAYKAGAPDVAGTTVNTLIGS